MSIEFEVLNNNVEHYMDSNKYFIEKQSSLLNPLFSQYLFIGKTNSDRYSVDQDYCIAGLRAFEESGSIAEALNIWEMLKQDVNQEKCYARYRANYWCVERRCDSTLIYELKHLKWLPDHTGKFYRPSEISVEELHPAFLYDDCLPMLKALEIGSSVYEDTNCILEHYAEKFQVEAKISIEEVLCFIGKGNAENHPLFYSMLYVRGDKRECIDYNYIIKGLEYLLERRSFYISKMIWDELCKDTNISCYTAAYKPNNFCRCRSCESSLIYYLRRNAWLPDKNKVLHKPCDIKLEDLHPIFKSYPHDNILNALGLGR